MKKILVTGGAGFIGAHITQKLINLGYKVLVVDNLSTVGGIPYINPKCKFIKGDITNATVIKKIENWRPNIIFHLAAQSGGESAYDNPKIDYLSNGYGTYMIAELAKKLKVKQLIYSSSVAVYGSKINEEINEKSSTNPDSIYGVSKFTGEMFIKQVLKKTKVKTVILRVFNTYGPGENLNFLKKGMISIYSYYLWRNKPIIVKGSLNRFRNFQYIDDVANIFVQTLRNKNLKKNEIINLTTGRITRIKDLLKILILENSKKKVKKSKIIIRKNTKGDSFGWNASNKYFRKIFPKFQFVSLKDGINKYFEWINKIPVKNDLKGYHPLDKKLRK